MIEALYLAGYQGKTDELITILSYFDYASVVLMPKNISSINERIFNSRLRVGIKANSGVAFFPWANNKSFQDFNDSCFKDCADKEGRSKYSVTVMGEKKIADDISNVLEIINPKLKLNRQQIFRVNFEKQDIQ